MHYIKKTNKEILGYAIIAVLAALATAITIDAYIVSAIAFIMIMKRVTDVFKRLEYLRNRENMLNKGIACVKVCDEKLYSMSHKCFMIGLERDNILSYLEENKYHTHKGCSYTVIKVEIETGVIYLILETDLISDKYKEEVAFLSKSVDSLNSLLEDSTAEIEEARYTEKIALEQVKKYMDINKFIYRKMKKAIASFKKIKTRNKTVLPLLEEIQEKAEKYI